MKRSEGLTAGEAAFVTFYEGRGTADKAAIKAGFKGNGYGRKLLQRPRVREAIKLKEGAKLQAIGRTQGVKTAKAVTITRNDIINRLDAESKNWINPPAARIAALGQLKDIFGLSANKDGKGDLFAGWTDEELEHYRNTGELPPRYGSILGQGGSDPGDSGTPAR